MATTSKHEQRRQVSFRESNHPALFYQGMLSDSVRNSAYRQAISAAVQPGDVVADLGTGLGLLAIMAVQAGASRVYAVDVRPWVMDTARRIAEANGVLDRIEFIVANAAQDLELPSEVDVIVNELIGDFGTDENIVECVQPVARRWLREGGSIVPRRLRTHLVGARYDTEFRGVYDEVEGIDLTTALSEPAEPQAVPMKLVRPVQALTTTATLEDHVFTGDMGTRTASHPFALEVTRTGTLQGFMGYFDTELSEEILLNNYPGYADCHWPQWHWPLTPAFPVRKGQRIEGELITPPGTLSNTWALEWEVLS